MSQDMPEENEAELRVMIQNQHDNFGTIGVLNCLIEMLESQLVVARKLREILQNEIDKP